MVSWLRRPGRSTLTGSSPHVVVLPGGGYAQHAAHEGEPIARWLRELGRRGQRVPLPADGATPRATRTRYAPRSAGCATAAQRGSASIGFSAGGHLAGLAALADGADADEAVDFAVLGYAITSMETETYRPARLILLGEDATPELRRATSLDALVTALLATVLSLAHSRRRVRPAGTHIPTRSLARRSRRSTCRPCLRPWPT